MTTAGRPTVLDPTKKEIIYALLQVGASQRRAAAVVGVSEAVIRYALKHDPDFAQRVEQAVALLEVELLVKLREGAGRSWRAAAYALEHLVPDRFAKNHPKPLFDPERAIERELEEMEEKAREQEQAAAEGKLAPPPPEPDPNDPTTKAARQFAEQLNKLLAECNEGSPTRKQGRIGDQPNEGSPTRKQGNDMHESPTRKRGSHTNRPEPTTDHKQQTTDHPTADAEFHQLLDAVRAIDSNGPPQPPWWQKTHNSGKPKTSART